MGRALSGSAPFLRHKKGELYAAEGRAGGSKKQGHQRRGSRGALGPQERALLAHREAPGGVAHLREDAHADPTGRGVALHVQHNSETAYSRVDEELAQRGVIFTDLHTALGEHEEIVKEHLFKLVPEDYDKFAALSAAAFSGGSFLYVPRGVEVEVPIQSYRWLDVVGSIMPRTLVVVEEGASVTYIDEYASADGEEPAFSNGAVELYVGEGANLRYVSLQNWERNVLHFNTIRSSTEKDATINSLVVSLGSQLSRTNVEAGLTSAGSDSEMLGLYFADTEQVLDHHTLQDHIAPNAHSDLLYKGALRDESLAVFSGLIRVEPGAQKTDAYQTNRNLILGTDDAMAV